MTNMSEERRSAKLHKQTEVEVDDGGEDTGRGKSSEADVHITAVSGGIPTPTVQSASSSSGTSPDESQPKVVIPPPITRKQTLIRGIALEGTSPPPESFFSQMPPNGSVQDSRLLANGASGTSIDGKKKGQSHEAKEFLLASHKISNDSGHGTIDHNDGASDTSVLSRDSSLENASVKELYKDSSGVNIPKFVRETLQKSAKDKKSVLSYEDQLLSFINNENAQTLKMAEMTSYDRMIVHRLAAFLGLDHNVDSTGKCVVLSRTAITRSVKLSEIIMFEESEQEPKKKILLKKPSSLDEKHSRGIKAPFASIRAKSLEERKQIYFEARERIFNQNDENQQEEIAGAGLLTANYIPQLHQQRSLDSMNSGSQLSTKWISTESSCGYESLKDSPNTYYGSPPMSQSSFQCPGAGPIVPSDPHSHIPGSPADSGPSPVAQSVQYHQLAYLVSSDYNSIPVGSLIINPLTMQLHVNADGSLYHFDPACPPPFMAQPQAQLPTSHIVYPGESIPELTTRFAATSIGSIDQGSEQFVAGIPGQAIPVVSAVIPQNQPIYPSAHPSQFTQGQYYATPSQACPQQVRYVTFPYPQGQGQHLLQATPVEGQGQTTVPMPVIGIPAVPGAGSYQMVGSPYQQAIMPGNQPHCVDFSGQAAAYHYGPVSEAMVVSGRPGCHTSSAPMGAPHLILTYSQPQPPQQHTILPAHQAPFTPTGSTAQGTYYTVPVSSPTPPLSHTQPPPSSHHQLQHQPTVYYTTSIRNPLTYHGTSSNPLSSSTTTLKSAPAPFIQTNYRPTTPPQQQQQQQLHHQSQQQQQAQSTVIAPSSCHHPTQLTLSYSHPVQFTAGQGQPITPVAAPQGSHLVTFQSNPYQVRPVGTAALIQLAGSPVIQNPQSGAGPQVQSYQLLRPAGSLQEVRMVSPSSVRPSLSSVQLTSHTSQQPRPKSNNQCHHNKRTGKRQSASRDDAELCGAQGASPVLHTTHTSTVTSVSLPGTIPQPQSHLPSSNRQ